MPLFDSQETNSSRFSHIVPQLMELYSSIISHPMDLGHVCRAIRRRKYKSIHDIQSDVKLIFSNCIKFQTHPKNEQKFPSLVSIARHLLEFFESLWQEYMVASDTHLPEREDCRKARLKQVSSTLVTTTRSASMIFVEMAV